MDGLKVLSYNVKGLYSTTAGNTPEKNVLGRKSVFVFSYLNQEEK